MTITATAVLWNDLDTYLADAFTTDLGPGSALYTTLLIAAGEIYVGDRPLIEQLTLPALRISGWTMRMRPGAHRGDGKAHTDNNYGYEIEAVCRSATLAAAKADIITIMQRVLLCLQSHPVFGNLASTAGESVQNIIYADTIEINVQASVSGAFLGVGSIKFTVEATGL
jgi:hypothetical protein